MKLKTGDWFLKSLFGFQFFMRITQTLVSCLLSCLIIDGSASHIHLIFSRFILARDGKTPWICPEDMHCFQNASSRQDCRQKKGGQDGEGLNAELLLGTDLQCWERYSGTKPALGLCSSGCREQRLNRTLMRSVVPLKHHIHSRPESRCCSFFKSASHSTGLE